MFLGKSNYYTPLFEAPETSRTLICQPLYRDHPYGCWPSRSKGGWTVEKGQFCLRCSWENDGKSMSILYFYDGKRWHPCKSILQWKNAGTSPNINEALHCGFLSPDVIHFFWIELLLDEFSQEIHHDSGNQKGWPCVVVVGVP